MFYLIKVIKKYIVNMNPVMYKVFRDAYNQKFKIKTWLFSKILSHMMEKLGREGTIFYLMSSMRKIQKQNR